MHFILLCKIHFCMIVIANKFTTYMALYEIYIFYIVYKISTEFNLKTVYILKFNILDYILFDLALLLLLFS